MGDIRSFLASSASAAGGTLAGQTRRHLRATLRRVLADAVRDGLIERNVGALAEAPKLDHTERTILDANQARILIESTKGTRYGPLWAILVTTGLRISEALGLSWSAVDWGGNDEGLRSDVGRSTGGHRVDLGGPGGRGASGVWAQRSGKPDVGSRGVGGPAIHVRHQLAREDGEWVFRKPKTAKGRRTVPLTPLGVEALRAQRQMQDADLGPRPRPIDGLVFILGHSSSRITADLYRHRVQELQQDAARKMQAVLG